MGSSTSHESPNTNRKPQNSDQWLEREIVKTIMGLEQKNVKKQDNVKRSLKPEIVKHASERGNVRQSLEQDNVKKNLEQGNLTVSIEQDNVKRSLELSMSNVKENTEQGNVKRSLDQGNVKQSVEPGKKSLEQANLRVRMEQDNVKRSLELSMSNVKQTIEQGNVKRNVDQGNVKQSIEPGNVKPSGEQGNVNVSFNQGKCEPHIKHNGYDDTFVRQMLEKCSCESVLQVFVDNEIDEASILLLSEEDLKSLLPTKLGPRKKIWAHIESLQKEMQAVSVNDSCSKAISDSFDETPESLTVDRTLTVKETNQMYSTPQRTSSYLQDESHHETHTFDSSDAVTGYMQPDRYETNYPQSVAASSSFEDDANAIRSCVDSFSSHSNFNHFSLNVQFLNQNLQAHNVLPEACDEATDKTRYDTEKKAHPRQKDRWPVKANHKPDTSTDDKRELVSSSVNQTNRSEGKKKYSFVKKVPVLFEKAKQLPIYKYKDEFLMMVAENPVVIVIAETGSGKSTQMPQYLARAGYDKKIICTQPRRLAAKSLAKRVAFEFGTKLGQEVGYRVRFDNCTENTTKISYVTEGVLVHELATDVTADNYSVVIIDEAHERNLNTDVLLGCLKKAIALRTDLKVVISSATVEAKKFSKFFNNAPVLDIPGRSFPVEISYTGKSDPDYLNALVEKVCSIHNSNDLGDILVFLPGQEEIEHAADTITNRIHYRPNAFIKELVLPLYSKLPSEQQNLIFDPAPPHTRKIILSTNIAETSLTIDGIVYVVDCGLVKQAEYVTKANSKALECTTLVTIPITKAQAKQRSGRAGRTQPGVAYRLYSEETYNKMAESPIPEILRGNLEMVVLLLFSMGVKNIMEFDFLDSPPRDTLLTALEKLEEFGALSKGMFQSSYTLTSIGKQMSGFPIEPYLSKMLIISADLGCSEEVLTIIAILSAQVDKLFKRPKKKRMEADLKKKTFHCPEGDHITLLQVYNEWIRKNCLRGWCNEYFLDWRTLEEVYEIRCQLSTMLDEKKIPRKSCGTDMEKVQIAIASGSFRKIAWRVNRYTYYTFSSPKDDPVLIHPSSVLFSASPNLVIYDSIIKTKKAYMNQVLKIDREYIEKYASNFYTKLVKTMPNIYGY